MTDKNGLADLESALSHKENQVPVQNLIRTSLLMRFLIYKGIIDKEEFVKWGIDFLERMGK